jgi:hypothetical protein
VAAYLKSESSPIDEKNSSFDIVLLPKFAQENFREGGRGRRKQPDMKQFVRLRIGGGVQSELLIVDSNHCRYFPNESREYCLNATKQSLSV